MAIADPVTTGVVLAGTLQAAKQVQDFIAAVTGHPGETIGTIPAICFSGAPRMPRQ